MPRLDRVALIVVGATLIGFFFLGLFMVLWTIWTAPWAAARLFLAGWLVAAVLAGFYLITANYEIAYVPGERDELEDAA